MEDIYTRGAEGDCYMHTQLHKQDYLPHGLHVSVNIFDSTFLAVSSSVATPTAAASHILNRPEFARAQWQ